MTWESTIRWCIVHDVSGVEDLDHCWKSQWFQDQKELIWKRCQIAEARITVESIPVGFP